MEKNKRLNYEIYKMVSKNDDDDMIIYILYDILKLYL